LFFYIKILKIYIKTFEINKLYEEYHSEYKSAKWPVLAIN